MTERDADRKAWWLTAALLAALSLGIWALAGPAPALGWTVATAVWTGVRLQSGGS